MLIAAPAWSQAPTSAAACHDFNAYVNGTWELATEIPANRASISSFDEVRRNNTGVLKDALAELVAEPAHQNTPGLQRLAAHYRSGMEETGISRRGLAALARALAVQLQAAPLEAWRHYLRVRLLDSLAEHLPPPLAQAPFGYHSGVLRGLQATPPRIERVTAAIGRPRGIAPLGHPAPPGRAGAAGRPPALEQQRRLYRQCLCRQRRPHRLSGRHLATAVFRRQR